MQESVLAAERGPSQKRNRGRPKKETIEQENMEMVLQSDLPSHASRRFLQKVNLLKGPLLPATHTDFDRENGD
jgi:hypothetical protein